jgi:hypothetical protein
MAPGRSKRDEAAAYAFRSRGQDRGGTSRTRPLPDESDIDRGFPVAPPRRVRCPGLTCRLVRCPWADKGRVRSVANVAESPCSAGRGLKRRACVRRPRLAVGFGNDRRHADRFERRGFGTGAERRKSRVTRGIAAKWGEQDSNLRRHSQWVYSPSPLTTRTSPREVRRRILEPRPGSVRRPPRTRPAAAAPRAASRASSACCSRSGGSARGSRRRRGRPPPECAPPSP